MAYQQIVGIPMATNCARLIAGLYLSSYDRVFMSDLHKSKHHDLIDMFKDTLTIYSPSITLNLKKNYSGYISRRTSVE